MVFPPTVQEVETAVPAFIGYTEKTTGLAGDSLLFVPRRISSFVEFEMLYGIAGDPQFFVLYHSMRLYFDNGGGDCYVVSIGDYTNSIQIPDFASGLDAVSEIDEPTLLIFPDAANLPGNGLYEVQKMALRQAESLGDRFCIFDLKFAATATDHSIVVNEFRNNIGTGDLKHGAAYTPWVKPTAGVSEFLPPSAAVAGKYCSVDRERGVWKAPANVSVQMVSDLSHKIDNSEQDRLNVNLAEGKSVNAIRTFPGKGILIWGARTLAGNDNEWRYVPVRRFYIMVEESVKKACEPFVFEPNDANTWVKIRAMVENYLTLKWRQGALAGAKPEHAFYVKVGLGQTMTAADLVAGLLIVEIGLAVIRPAEFIILRFSQKMVGN